MHQLCHQYKIILKGRIKSPDPCLKLGRTSRIVSHWEIQAAPELQNYGRTHTFEARKYKRFSHKCEVFISPGSPWSTAPGGEGKGALRGRQMKNGAHLHKLPRGRVTSNQVWMDLYTHTRSRHTHTHTHKRTHTPVRSTHTHGLSYLCIHGIVQAVLLPRMIISHYPISAPEAVCSEYTMLSNTTATLNFKSSLPHLITG